MRRNSYFIRIALLICLFTRILVAQNSDPSGTGYPENAVYHGGDLDSVQLGNGNLHLEIPIWSAKGRGLDTGAKFVYDSKVWTIDWYDGGLGYVYGSVNTRLFSKPNIHVENSSGYFIYYETGILDCEGISGGPFVTYSYSLIEPGGTVRKFLPYSMSYTAGGCNASATPGTFYADDGSGWMLQATSPGQVVAIRKDGLRVTLDTTVYDRNGNYIAQSTNNVTDTLGRSVSGTGSYVDSNGVSQAPQIAYTNVPVQSNLCQYTSGPDPYPKDANWIECHEYSATIPQVSSITLPGELPFTLEYTQNQLAEPSSMTLPTGGAIAWTWIDGNQYGRRVRTRSVDGNLWNYVLPDPNQNGMLSVVAPDLSHMDVAGDPVSQWKYYDSQNHLLKTVVTGFTSYSASLFNYIIYLPTSVTTTLADTGQVSKTETDYETFGYNVPGSNDYFPISSRNPLQIREYDWGAGTAGPLLRTTTFTYWHQQHASYRNNNVNDLVASSIVSGGSGPASKVLTYYDESFPSGRTGVPNHNCTGQPCASNIRGNPTTTSVWLDTTNTWLNTTRTFDDLGNVLTELDPGLHTTTFNYTDSYASSGCVAANTLAFATTVTDAKQFQAKNKFYPCTGALQSTRDQNDLNANRTGIIFVYDAHGRTTSVTESDGGVSTSDFETTSIQQCKPSTTAQPSVCGTSYLDDLGRISHVQAPSGASVFYSYDNLGRTISVSNPQFTQGDTTAGSTQYEYDALNRVKKLTHQPDGNHVDTEYIGNTVTVTDQSLRKHKWQTDGLGRSTDVWEDPAGLNYRTSYIYDTFGNLTNVLQNGSHPRTFHYDSLGNLKDASNPESGTTTYSYAYDATCNPDRKLRSKTDAKGQIVTYCYDQLQRVTQRNASGIQANYYYDGNFPPNAPPQLQQVTNAVGRLSFGSNNVNDAYSIGYDPMGRTNWEQLCFPSACDYSKNITAHYNYDSSLDFLVYPSGRKVTFQYDNAARLINAKFASFNGTAVNYDYYNALSFWPNGQVAGDTLGNGLGELFGQNNRLQSTEFKISGVTPSVFMDLKPCMYDTSGGIATDCTTSGHNNGNVIAIRDVLNANRNQRFQYDPFNRLTIAAQDDPAGWGQNFGIDPWGNLQTITTTKGSLPGLNCAADGNNRLSTCFGYDASGNLTTNGSTQYQFDAENRIINVGNQSPQMYSYDTEGMRAYKNIAGDKTSYIYFGGQPVAEAHETANGLEWSDYIFAGSRTVAKADAFFHEITILGTNTTSSQASTFRISNPGIPTGYTIRNHDKLYFYQYEWTGTEAGLMMGFTDGSVTNWIAKDQYGNFMDQGMTNGVRIVDLSSFAGKQFSYLNLVSESGTAPGNWAATFHDISLVNDDGSVISIYSGQAATPATFDWSNGATNQICSVNPWVGRYEPGAATAYYHGDQIGSARMMSSANGYPVWQGTYTPFGVAVNTQVTPNHYNFTGKERDTESGLDYFGARYYGSSMGRFMSPDPLGIASGSLANPQSLNLYSYVLNNPLIFSDPDGRECVWDDGSYDSNDDEDTGSPDKCSGQGGTWIGHDVFANSSYYRGDWSGDANSSLGGLVGNIQSCSAAVGGGQGASLLIANAFASGFSNDMTAYTLASAAWETGPGGIGTNMTEVGSPSYFNKYNGILGNKSNSDAFAYRGRGYVQITGKSNYQHWSNELGLNLVANPNLAAMPDAAAQIAVEGLDKGTFTGVSLYNYVNPGGTDFVNARRTINGTDNAQAIATSANSFSQSMSGCR